MVGVFSGWRQETGVAALLLALMVTAAWIRSLGTRDLIFGPCVNSAVVFRSYEGCLGYERIKPDPDVGDRWRWTTETGLICNVNDQWYPLDIFETDAITRRFDWAGFSYGFAKRQAVPMESLEIWIIPYWSIALVTTLVSAYLLFGKRLTKASFSSCRQFD